MKTLWVSIYRFVVNNNLLIFKFQLFQENLLEQAKIIEMFDEALEEIKRLKDLDSNANYVYTFHSRTNNDLQSQSFNQPITIPHAGPHGVGCLTPGHGAVARCDSYCLKYKKKDITRKPTILSNENIAVSTSVQEEVSEVVVPAEEDKDKHSAAGKKMPELGTDLYLQPNKCGVTDEPEPGLTHLQLPLFSPPEPGLAHLQLPLFSPPQQGCFNKSVQDWNSREILQPEPQTGEDYANFLRLLYDLQQNMRILDTFSIPFFLILIVLLFFLLAKTISAATSS